MYKSLPPSWFASKTSSLRALPDFIVIGAQKGGTTALFRYLVQHPSIVPSCKKEIHFFDSEAKYENWGVYWYRSHFPLSARLKVSKLLQATNVVTGEASPYYVFNPEVPKRLYDTVPKAKLILVVRNPVDRAYSHYQHSLRSKDEFLSFEEAIEEEGRRLDGVDSNLNDRASRFRHISYSYLSRGRYIEQINKYLEFFDKEQILVVCSEQLREDRDQVLSKVWDFLNIKDWHPKEPVKINARPYQEISQQTRNKLLEYFSPYNEKLYEYVGESFGWR